MDIVEFPSLQNGNTGILKSRNSELEGEWDRQLWGTAKVMSQSTWPQLRVAIESLCSVGGEETLTNQGSY